MKTALSILKTIIPVVVVFFILFKNERNPKGGSHYVPRFKLGSAKDDRSQRLAKQMADFLDENQDALSAAKVLTTPPPQAQDYSPEAAEAAWKNHTANLTLPKLPEHISKALPETNEGASLKKLLLLSHPSWPRTPKDKYFDVAATRSFLNDPKYSALTLKQVYGSFDRQDMNYRNLILNLAIRLSEHPEARGPVRDVFFADIERRLEGYHLSDVKDSTVRYLKLEQDVKSRERVLTRLDPTGHNPYIRQLKRDFCGTN